MFSFSEDQETGDSQVPNPIVNVVLPSVRDDGDADSLDGDRSSKSLHFAPI